MRTTAMAAGGRPLDRAKMVGIGVWHTLSFMCRAYQFSALRRPYSSFGQIGAYQPLPTARSCGVAYPFALNWRSEEHTSELQSLMRISSAVFCLKQKNKNIHTNN